MEDWYKKLKPGDKFRCKDKAEPNLSSDAHKGGAGFVSGMEYILGNLELRDSYAILWPKGGGNGVYSNSVVKPISIDSYEIF